MKRAQLVWVLMVPFLCLLGSTVAVIEAEVRSSLISFLRNLANDPRVAAAADWDVKSDPCVDGWNGIGCDVRNASVTKLRLERFNLSGSLDMGSLCNVPAIASSLARLVLNGNNLGGGVPAQISICRQLTHLQIGGNKLEGKLPDSLATLDNLKVLNVSYNKFSGALPNLSRISGLRTFLAQDNQLSGEIPAFDFYNFDNFNVSYNNFSGQIPDVGGYFNSSSFVGNPLLCGYPLQNSCPRDKRKGVSGEDVIMYSGYALLGSVLVGAVGFKLCRKKRKTDNVDAENNVSAIDGSGSKPTVPSSEHKTSATRNRSEVSATATSVESGVVSSSLVVVTSPTVNGLRFEELLQAPAELLGRGKHGSLYKVICENGAMYAVKRIKDWAISGEDFKKRMQRIDQVKHPNVLPVSAFYSSKQEKLLVYEFKQNGSLFRLLQGTQMRRAFEWGSRLNFAASIAEGLATMHRELRDISIAHGNLKSSNILLTKDMEPCISEYGLMVQYDHQDLTPSITPTFKPEEKSNSSASRAFSSDVYGFGVILLELLTGKMVHDKGFDLPKWVLSVVQEEWTVEVFDKSLFTEVASEERMVNLLQVAIKCVNRSPEERPSMTHVASMIAAIKEEEDRSLGNEP
ncbi:hypothetical protein BT93_J1512 [Corymbia citriodora subsp. variegata]|nr:hypothetical protein BT93_J1512 [Corymbia citriodora subsp. variegata]